MNDSLRAGELRQNISTVPHTLSLLHEAAAKALLKDKPDLDDVQPEYLER